MATPAPAPASPDSASDNNDDASSPNNTPVPPLGTNTRFVPPEYKGLKKLSRRHRTATSKSHHHPPPLQPWPGWETRGREPYHEYVHNLVLGGWDNLAELDTYMAQDLEDAGLVISVVDITSAHALRRHDDIHDVGALNRFLADVPNREGVKVRLYLAEQQGDLAAGVMEAFGAALELDPRFFQWNLRGNHKLLSPAQRHRAPFTTINFSVLRGSVAREEGTERFRVSVYVKTGRARDEWTGIILFNSHSQISLHVETLVAPPLYTPTPSPPPPATTDKLHSFRALYLASLPHLSLRTCTLSPFYATHPLFLLNGYCWNQLIDSTRRADAAANGFATTSVSQVEDIRKTADIVGRGGSLGWPTPAASSSTSHRPNNQDEPENEPENEKEKETDTDATLPEETKAILLENFAHLLSQANLLWETRQKMSAVRQQRRDARTTALTNAFTFLFAPLSLISGIYGMNISQISGSSSNPSAWQPVVAVAVLNVGILVVLAVGNWLVVLRRFERRAGWKEIVGFAVGRLVLFLIFFLYFFPPPPFLFFLWGGKGKGISRERMKLKTTANPTPHPSRR